MQNSVINFKEDPKKMLDFITDVVVNEVELDDTTWGEIKESHSAVLKLDKVTLFKYFMDMYEQGDRIKTMELLFNSGIVSSLFKYKCIFDDQIKELCEDIVTKEDFFCIMSSNNHEGFSKVFNTKTDIKRGIKAIGSVFKGIEALGVDIMNEGKHRLIAFDAMRISKSVRDSGIIPKFMQNALQSLDGETYPIDNSDIPVKKDDLLNLGITKDNVVKKILNNILISVLMGEYPMDKDILLEMVRRGRITS